MSKRLSDDEKRVFSDQISLLQNENIRLTDRIEELEADVAGMRDNENAALNSLLKFWNALTENLFEGSLVDSMDLYEMGVEHGLLHIEVYDPEGVHKGMNFGCELVEGDDVYINNLYGRVGAHAVETVLARVRHSQGG